MHSIWTIQKHKLLLSTQFFTFHDIFRLYKDTDTSTAMRPLNKAHKLFGSTEFCTCGDSFRLRKDTVSLYSDVCQRKEKLGPIQLPLHCV
jgi:hypothetical protein